MKTLKNNWAKLAGVFTLAGLAVCAVYACISVWSQSAPVLTIAATATNQVAVTITNGVPNGLYQIYYRQDLTSDNPWIFATNGAVNQTNFLFNTADTITGYFEAAYNTNFVLPTISVIIQSPTNGALIY